MRASTSFVFLKADWSVGDALRRIHDEPAGHIIVQRTDQPEEEYFYLFDLDHALGLLGRWEADVDLRRALDLHEYTSTLTIDLKEGVLPGERCVVLDGGRLAGFLDPQVLVPMVPSPEPGAVAANGGGTRDAGPTAEPRGDMAAPPGPRPPLTRFPQLDFQDEIPLAIPQTLTVSLLVTPPPDMNDAGITILDEAENPPVVDVVVRARGFTIGPSNTQQLEVSRDGDSEVRFTLTPRTAGEQVILVDFYQGSRRLGTAMRNVLVLGPGTAAAGVPVPPAVLEPLEFTPVGTPSYDMEIRVDVKGKELTFTLYSRRDDLDYFNRDAGTVELSESPLEKFEAVYGDLTRFARGKPATQLEQERQLRKITEWGEVLWDKVIPNELKAEYWTFKDKVRSLVITSDEPWIPWEIVKPYRFDAQGKRIEEPHWCQTFVLARWLTPTAPATPMNFHRVRPVAPSSTNLKAVDDEIGFIQRLSDLNSNIVADPPYNDCERVIDMLENGDFSIMHVAAHGSFNAITAETSTLTLDDGPLSPIDVRVRFMSPRKRPLIFLNACHGSRSAESFTGLGGWAQQLVSKARVGAFIGASWEVNDALALAFTEAFYRALLGGVQGPPKSIGEACREAREAIRAQRPENSTWLAYVLYADPTALPVVG